MEVYLVRHTKPNIEKGFCYGQSDIEVANSFQSEIIKIKEQLPVNIELVFTSPLKRCEILARNIKTENLQISKNLMELNFGDWELKSWEEIHKNDLNNWMENYIKVAPPNGESFEVLFNRVNLFWNEKIRNSKKNIICIITHAGVIRSILALLLKLELSNSFNLSIDYGSITKIDICNSLTTIKYINR